MKVVGGGGQTAGSGRPALELCLFPFKSADFLLAIAVSGLTFVAWPYLRLRRCERVDCKEN